MATAKVRRYLLKDVTANDFVTVMTVPAGQVFVLSGIWTFTENTVHVRIVPASGEPVLIADSSNEAGRLFRGLVLDSQDTLQVKIYTTGTKDDVVVAGELFDKS